MTTGRHRVLALVVGLAVAGVHAPARADDASEAQLQYELGVELYKQRKYAEALERFLASNRLVPNANVVFNIAQTYQVMSRPQEAYNWYETYLTEHDAGEQEREAALEARDRLQKRLAVVEVKTEPAGATLYLDRVDLGAVGESPRRVAVEPGGHRILAHLEGHREGSVQVEVERGDVVSVELELERIMGTLSVESTPAGAQVRLEQTGEQLGETPLSKRLPVGGVRLVVRRDGYVEQTRDATIRDGATTEVSLRLQREASTVAVLSVATDPAGATVVLDGEEAGRAPVTLDDLPPGSHELTVRAPDRQPWSTGLLLEAGAATRVDATLADPEAGAWPGWRWVGYGSGAALLATGGIVGLVSYLDRKSFFDDDNPTRSQLDAVRAKNIVADVLMGVGVAILGVTLVLDLTGDGRPRSSGQVSIDR